ncbi:hypothetical protein CDD80_2460 [Ophiocordyceps camponoti-rufipedis]|uniref:Uncharacterized protein n=1 Tax=Ophiocordyceps camponoti-rufipedis TaxID=2004952 RepID=A0A2C5XKA3_9HYPO|nr:hypothetical protein CDD80_2460 [Ophiocordyceps camponoti-rufipedis]
MSADKESIPNVDLDGYLDPERIYDVLECDVEESDSPQRQIIITSHEVRNVVYHSFPYLYGSILSAAEQWSDSRREMQRLWDVGKISIVRKRGTIREKHIDYFYTVCSRVGDKAEEGQVEELMDELWEAVEGEGIMETME